MDRFFILVCRRGDGGGISLRVWWARLDSNQEPTDYESAALTVELRAPRFSYLTHSPQRCSAGHSLRLRTGQTLPAKAGRSTQSWLRRSHVNHGSVIV